MEGSVYIKFGITGTYFEVEPEKINPFGEEFVLNMPIKRKKWDKIIIKNKPLAYKSSAVDKNKLYDVILATDPTIEIFIKYISSEAVEIEGYFGVIDCEINDFQTFIEITPTIYDQYTDVLENMNTKVDVFEGDNLIKNPNFDSWAGGSPNDWTVVGSLSDISSDKILDKTCIVIDAPAISLSINQIVYNIVSGRNVNISFQYALMGTSTDREDLTVKIFLTGDSGVYHLTKDGEWTSDSSSFDYVTNKLPTPEANLTKYTTFSKISDPAPISGNIHITFYHSSVLLGDRDSSLVLTNVNVKSSDIEYFEVSLNLLADNLVSKEQKYIEKKDGTYISSNFIASPKKSEALTLDEYFESGGEPKQTVLSSTTFGPHGSDDLRYPDWDTAFADSSSKFYKAEMSELTVYDGGTWKDGIWPFNVTRRKIRAVATYSREEVRKVDEDDGGGGLVPPAIDVGWEQTTDDDASKGGRLWVRTPFNDAISTWTIGTIDETGGSIYEHAWEKKLTSKKNYPVNDNSETIEGAVSFKSIIEQIYRRTHTSLAGKAVYSTFLFNDLPSDAKTVILQDRLSGFYEGLNYYTMQDNVLASSFAVHTYQLKTDKVDGSDDSILKVSLSELMDDLRVLFPAYFFIDEDLNLHIEHVYYEDVINDFTDLRDIASNYQYWKYDKEKMFSLIEYEMVNSGYQDFLFSNMEFAKATSNKRNQDIKDTKKTSVITTDIQYCIENPDDIDNGIIWVNYETIDSVNKTVIAPGQRSGLAVTNGNLSLATLIRKYSKYEGTWENGKINGEDVEFDNTSRTKHGIDKIELSGIYSDDYFLTDLGIGIAIKTIDYEKNTTVLDSIYRYVDWFIIVEENNIVEL